MAFRRRTPFRRGVKKKAIWVNIPFGGVNYTESVGTQLLVTPEDWEAQFGGNANETAVLRAVVGEIVFSQTAVGTAGGNFFWGIYIADKDATVPPVFTTAGLADSDWLRMGARATTSSITASVLQSTMLSSEKILIKAKRRLKSRDSISLAIQYGADAASPAGIASGILRFLIARD